MLSEHFSEKEFRCHCGRCEMPTISPELLEVLEELRSEFTATIVITSGYRCPEHNKAVRGELHSKHMEGIAADIKVYDRVKKQMPPEIIYAYLSSRYPAKYGIGKYRAWTHIDVRPTRARWEG